MVPSDAISQLVARIAQDLEETADAPRRQIRRIVQQCGAVQALAWLEQTQAIELAGGMRTTDGSRRRTPGGVYFKLVRDHLLQAGLRHYVRAIWQRRRPSRPGPTGLPAPSTTMQGELDCPAAMSWNGRGAMIGEARAQTGKVQQVNITIIGRPGRVVERSQVTLLLLKHAGPLPALPKGIPVLPHVPETTYIVYVAAQQWRKVKDALTNPDDMLIVEGVQFYDATYQAIAVFARRTTTQLMQAARQAADRTDPPIATRGEPINASGVQERNSTV